MTTEYERLLKEMLDERKAELESVRGKKGSERKAEALASEMQFIEGELERYQNGLFLFRTKSPPRAGRWGKGGLHPGQGE